MNDLVPIDFHGDTVWAGRPSRRAQDPVLVAVRPIVERLGLGWPSQWHRIQRNELLAEGVIILTSPLAGGEQSTTSLPLNLLPGFLLGISTDRVPDPEVRERVLTYQRECHDVLYQHFCGRVAERRSRAVREELATKVKAVQVAMQLSSNAAARSVWNELGLPHLTDEDPGMRPAHGSGNARRTVEPALDFDGSFGEDPRLVAVRQFLVERVERHDGGEITNDEMYRAYTQWAVINGAPAMKPNSFGLFTKRLKLPKAHRNDRRIYLGLRFKLTTPETLQ